MSVVELVVTHDRRLRGLQELAGMINELSIQEDASLGVSCTLTFERTSTSTSKETCEVFLTLRYTDVGSKSLQLMSACVNEVVEPEREDGPRGTPNCWCAAQGRSRGSAPT